MWKIQLLGWFCAILRLNITFSIRFIQASQVRNEKRGRALGVFDNASEAITAYNDILTGNSYIKENEHGEVYLCIEARTESFPHFPAHERRRHRHGEQVDAFPAEQSAEPTGAVHARVPGHAVEQPAPAHAQKADHAVKLGAGESRGVHQQDDRQQPAAGTGEPVEVGLTSRKIDLSDIGLQQ